MIKLSKIFLSLTSSKKSKVIVFAAGCCLASGCSMLNKYAETRVKNVIGPQMEEFTKLEPDVQRVLALESDMQIIIAELGKYSNLGTDPLGNDDGSDSQFQTNNDNDASSNANNQNGNTAEVNVNRCGQNSNTLSGHCDKQIGIHLAAFSDSQYVLPGWLYLKNKLPAVLQAKMPLRTEIHKKNTTYYSLRLGPFTSVTQAKQACDGLSLQIPCSVTEYYGQRIGGGV